MGSFLYYIFDKLPYMPEIPNLDVAINVIKDIITNVGYFIPLDTLLFIFTTWIVFINFKFWFKLIVRVWESIPFN